MTRLVAITGASGFVGSHIAAAFAEAGWRCRALLRPGSPPPETPVEVVRGALDQAEALGQLVEGADAVVHAAGLTVSRDPEAFARVNVAGTEQMIAAWSAHCPEAAFVLISSMAARVPELSPYAASKREAEARLSGQAGRWSILRPAAVYGPRDAATRALFRMADGPVQPLLGPAEARLYLIHAEDVARAVVAAAEGAPAGACWELSDARRDGYGWRETAIVLAEALGRTPRPVTLPPALVDALGWAAEHAPALQRIIGPLTPAKIRELRHLDWSSSVGEQPPATLWSPQLDLAAGFRRTISALMGDSTLSRRGRPSGSRLATETR
ncbi:MAG: NAD(P)-dependent oxidoreductase [Pseudomonadota bacterium]